MKQLDQNRLMATDWVEQFSIMQKNQLWHGVTAGVDVSAYANPKLDWQQMREIRRGLENGIDVSVYSEPDYHWTTMKAMRERLEKHETIRLQKANPNGLG